jgi:selenocysteine-specific elongation factor
MLLLHPDRLNDSRAVMMGKVRDHHKTNPLLPGISRAELRRKCELMFPSQVCDIIIEGLLHDGELVSEDHWIHAPDHEIRLTGHQKNVVQRIEELLSAAHFQTPKQEEIAQKLGQPLDEIRELITIMINMGKVIRVGSDLLFLQDQLAEARTQLDAHFQSNSQVSVGEVSQLLGSTRKYVVPLLEHFDREGFTMRQGDVRIKRS